MQITYDTKADAMYIKFCDGEFMANKEVEEGIILDIGKDNGLLGIEILEASSRFRPEELARVEIQMPRPQNPNPLLEELENWLSQQDNILPVKIAKTMNCYQEGDARRRLLWVWTTGQGRIQLRKLDYTPADPERRVRYDAPEHRLWGGYPQFDIVDKGTLEYAKRLIAYARGRQSKREGKGMAKLGKPIEGMSKEERSTTLGKAGVRMSHSKHGDIAGVKPRRRRNKTNEGLREEGKGLT